jgi:hypothetical protein
MKRNVFTFILLVLFVAAASAAAQSPGKILKQANQALGGERALSAVRSWQKTGKITRLKDGASGNFTMQAAAPSFYNAAFDLNGFETEVGYNGKSGWTRDSREGLRTLTGESSRDFAAEAAYRNSRWLNYKKEKSKIVAGGSSTVNGKSANLLILTTAKGASVKMFFDASTGLLIREEIPTGNTIAVSDYSDYRAVNGIQEPFSITQKSGDDVYEIKLEQIIHNQQIAKDVFNFPQFPTNRCPIFLRC